MSAFSFLDKPAELNIDDMSVYPNHPLDVCLLLYQYKFLGLDNHFIPGYLYT